MRSASRNGRKVRFEVGIGPDHQAGKRTFLDGPDADALHVGAWKTELRAASIEHALDPGQVDHTPATLLLSQRKQRPNDAVEQAVHASRILWNPDERMDVLTAALAKLDGGTTMQTAAASTVVDDAREAGRRLAADITRGLGREPQALMVFAAPSYDHEALLDEIAMHCPAALVVGASSAGEFMNHERGEGLATALGLAGDDVRFSVGVARDIAGGAAEAARQISSSFKGLTDYSFPHRSALVMADVLAGHADLLVDELTLATGGQYQFFGGGAGDNAQFQRTAVFFGREVLTGAAVALEMLTAKPVGIGVRHGWAPASAPFRVTEADGMRLISLNGLPAAEIFEAHAATTGQRLDRAAPIPFFLHNILGIERGETHRLRVPLAVLSDGSILCAAEVPQGAVVYIMRASAASAVEAAQEATQAALAALGGLKPQAALFFDCVATRLRMGDQFSEEVETVRDQLAGADLVGCNTHGQIARAEGQFEGFHNCTAVVVVVPA